MGEKNAGRGKPLHPKLAKLSPSALRASGLQTLLAKVKIHIKYRRYSLSIAVGFVPTLT